MTDYSELVKSLRYCNGPSFLTCRECRYNNDMLSCQYKMLRDAATAIETLQAELDQWKAAVKGQEDGIKVLQAEVERLQGKLCDWCAVCPKERRKPEDCEMLSETPVMYRPSCEKKE